MACEVAETINRIACAWGDAVEPQEHLRLLWGLYAHMAGFRVLALPVFLLSVCSLLGAGQIYRLPDDEMIPEYARASIRSEYGGFNVAVAVRVNTDELGRVTHVHALRGPKGAYSAAEQAERQLRFKPFVRNGKAVRASFIDEVWLLPVERWLTPRVRFPDIRDPGTLALRMERRSWCFEPRCMYYDVEVHGDGKVKLLQGGFSFRQPKVYTGEISSQSLTALVNEFRQADFFSFQDAYVTDVTDCQGAILLLAFDGRRKSVGEYCGVSAGAPAALFKLEKRFDEIVDTKRWLRE